MFTLILSTVVGLQTPVIKVGYCPLGWYSSGSYCVPSSSTSRPIVEKKGTCPLGWTTSGNYCRD